MEASTPKPETDAQTKQSALNQWMMVGVGLTAIMSVMAIIVSVVALGSSSNARSESPAAAAAPSSASTAATKPAPAAFKVLVKADDEHGRLGPGHVWHDAFLPANFTVKPGQTVDLTVYNYDGGTHSFTAPTLGLNAVIGAGSDNAPRVTTVKFTAPSQPGTYQWWCADPCDPWAMSHQGYMQGTVTVSA